MNINGREYTVEKFPITSSLAFVPEVLEAIGPALGGIVSAFEEGKTKDSVFKGLFGAVQSSKLTAIMKKALNQVITPENTYLKNAAVFEEWFARYPEDLFHLAGFSVWELSKDFLPRPLATLAGGLILKASQSASPTAGA